MANNKEEAGKGTPRPGEMPGSKRTYATIDLPASEVEAQDKGRPPAAAASATSASAASVPRQMRKPPDDSAAMLHPPYTTREPAPSRTPSYQTLCAPT